MIPSSWADTKQYLQKEWDSDFNTQVALLMLKEIREQFYKFIMGLNWVERVNELPNRSGVYFYIDNRDGKILYIGKSFDIKKRWKARKDFSICDGERVYYWINKSQFWDMNTMEGLLILLFSPRYNRGVRCRTDLHAWEKAKSFLEATP